MKVHYFNTSLNGGAAIGAIRQFESVVSKGADGSFYTNTVEGKTGLYEVYNPWDSQRLWGKLTHYWQLRRHYRFIEHLTASKRDRYEKFSTAYLPYATPYTGSSPDIIHLHWISDWIDLHSFLQSVPDGVPIFWTLHDMYPFTGGCHYNWGCDNFRTSCHHCPQLAVPATNDLSAKSFRVKENAFRNKKLHVLANSHWMADKAKQSALFKDAKNIETLHLPIDTAIYKPLSKPDCKLQFGISPDTLVVAFGAERVTNYRKGFDLLLSALSNLRCTKPIQLLYFGRQSLELEQNLPFPVKYVGFVEPGAEQANVYNAADVFVIPSREEAFGQTALEAISCGVPVVGFDTGGIPDTVIHRQTGLLVDKISAEALASQLGVLIENDNLRMELAHNGRRHAIENFDMDVQGKKLLALYHTALG